MKYFMFATVYVQDGHIAVPFVTEISQAQTCTSVFCLSKHGSTITICFVALSIICLEPVLKCSHFTKSEKSQHWLGLVRRNRL